MFTLPGPQSLAIYYFGDILKESGGERSDGKGREPVSKMADALMADFPEFPRPVHEAVLKKSSVRSKIAVRI